MKNRLIFLLEFLITIPIVYYAYQKVPLLNKGGLVMIPLSYALLFVIFIFIERILFLKKTSDNIKELQKSIEETNLSNSTDNILAKCNAYPSPLAVVIKTIVKYKEKTLSELKTMAEETVGLELPTLSASLDFLALLIRIAPLLGLLGTVTGLLHTFEQMVKLSNNISASAFAAGISEALLTTIFGLSIAIPAAIAHQYLNHKVKGLIVKIEKAAIYSINKLKNI